MIIKNDDIITLIKMENIIGKYEKIIFGEDKQQKIKIDNNIITHDDFIKFINIIEKATNKKKEYSEKSNIYNKNNKEYHTIINSISYYKKKNNQKMVDYWQEKLKEYKKNKKI